VCLHHFYMLSTHTHTHYTALVYDAHSPAHACNTHTTQSVLATHTTQPMLTMHTDYPSRAYDTPITQPMLTTHSHTHTILHYLCFATARHRWACQPTAQRRWQQLCGMCGLLCSLDGRSSADKQPGCRTPTLRWQCSSWCVCACVLVCVCARAVCVHVLVCLCSCLCVCVCLCTCVVICVCVHHPAVLPPKS